MFHLAIVALKWAGGRRQSHQKGINETAQARPVRGYMYGAATSGFSHQLYNADRDKFNFRTLNKSSFEQLRPL
jgi:hypothetical protein